MLNLFLDHPRSVCLTYYDHFKLSMTFSYKFGIASLKALVHAIFPFFFIKSTTNIINELKNQINKSD